MVVMAPELVEGAAGGAAAGGLGGLLGGHQSDRLDGSSAAFMLSIVLLMLALIALWIAFHNPAEWDSESGQWPGLVKRVVKWAQTHAEGPGLLGDLATSQPAAVSPDQAAINAITRIEGNPVLGAPLPPTEQKSLAQKLISTLRQLIGGGIL